MKKLDVLVLTDHTTHEKGESIYYLLQSMTKIELCSSIFIVSRGNEENHEFFEGFAVNDVYGKPIDTNFCDTEHRDWYKDGISKKVSEFDVIFLMLDRPVSDNQLLTLKSTFSDHIIVNDPQGIIETGSKKFLLQFKELCPEMALCKSLEDVEREAEKYQVVLKPINGYGGEGLIRVSKDYIWFQEQRETRTSGRTLLNQQFENGREMLAMKFLKNVTKGDKRVLVVGKKIMGSFLRTPADGSWLCNMKQGGQANFSSVTEKEKQIAETIIPALRKNGVVIFGFDTLEDDHGERVLSEINTLNVGGFIQAQEFSGQPVVERASNQIWQYLKEVSKRRLPM
jgi:glutathione synthase